MYTIFDEDGNVLKQYWIYNLNLT